MTKTQAQQQLNIASGQPTIKSFFYGAPKNHIGEYTVGSKKKQKTVNLRDLVLHLLNRDVQTHYHVIAAVCENNGVPVTVYQVGREARLAGVAGTRHTYRHNGKINTTDAAIAVGFHSQFIL